VVVVLWGVTWNAGLACRRRACVELCQQDQSSRIVRTVFSTEDQIEDAVSGMPGSSVAEEHERVAPRGPIPAHLESGMDKHTHAEHRDISQKKIVK
jgi:hypothetical protein